MIYSWLRRTPAGRAFLRRYPDAPTICLIALVITAAGVVLVTVILNRGGS